MATENLVAELRADISQFRTEMQRATQVADRTGRDIERSNQRTSQSFATLTRGVAAVGTAIAALGILGLGRDIAQAGIQAQSLTNAFKAITGSSEAARAELEFIRVQSERLGLEFVSTAKGFQGISAAARGTILEGKAVRDVFLGVVEASTTLGLSSDQTSGALNALSQIISKGTVQAEELRGQLGERIPGAFQIAARAMGVTTQELGKFLELGQITAEEFIPRFGRQLTEEFARSAVEASDSVRASFNRLTNSINELRIAIAESGFLEALAATADGITAIFRSFAEGQAFGAASTEIQRLRLELDALNAQLQPFLGISFLGPTAERAAELREEIERTEAAIIALLQGGEIAAESTSARIVTLKAEISSVESDIKALEDGARRFNRELTNIESAAIEGAREKLRELNTELEFAEKTAKAFGFSVEEATKKLETAGAAGTKAFSATSDAAKSAFQLIENFANESTDAIVDSFEERQRLEQESFEASERITEMREELLRRELEANQRTFREFAEIRRRAENEQIREQQRQQAETVRELEQQAQDAERAFERFGERVENSLADVFERSLRGGFDFFETLEDLAISTAARIAAAFAAQQLIIPGLQAVGGLLGVGAADAASAPAGATQFGAGGQFLGTSSGLGGAGTFGAGGAFSSTGLLGGATGPGTGVFGAAVGPATLGTFIGGAAIGTGAGLISSELLTQAGVGGEANAVTAGAVGGAAAGTFVFPGIGTAIGAAIGALGGFLANRFGSSGGGTPEAAFFTSAPERRDEDPFFEDEFFREGPFGRVGLFDPFTQNVNDETTRALTDFVLQLDQTAAAFLTEAQRDLARRGLLRQSEGVQVDLSEVDTAGAELVADRLSVILKSIAPFDLRFVGIEAFEDIELREENLGLLEQRFQAILQIFNVAEELGMMFEGFDAAAILRGGDSLIDGLTSLQRIVEQLLIVEQVNASIEAQITALEEVLKTPAELFEARLDQIASLQGQLVGAGIEEALAITPQIQGLVGQALQLAIGEDVLGQDPGRLQQTQDDLIMVLRDLQATLSSIPSFQGLQEPLTFGRSTLASIHEGETLLPAGTGSMNIERGAIVINAQPGQNADDIADAVVRRIEQRGRFSQTTINTTRRRGL